MIKTIPRTLLPISLAVLSLVLLFIPVLRQLLMQVLAGYALMGLALPISRLYEKKLSPSLSAALALATLWGAVLLLLLLFVPLVLRQFQQALNHLPQRQFDLPLPDLSPLLKELAQAVPGLMDRLRSMAGSLGRLMLAPVLAFYFLRDRQSITRRLCLWIPLGYRARAVRAAREARRELVGFWRGQVLLALAVGSLTALGLALVGLPAWLLLGLLMGVMEFIPYLGPILAAIPALLFALPLGLGATLWTLGLLLLVQQLESTLLSPRLMAGATSLHPAAVLLAISFGGMAAGVMGMLLSLPLAVMLRGALRGIQR